MLGVDVIQRDRSSGTHTREIYYGYLSIDIERMYWSLSPEGIILKEHLCASRITIWYTMPPGSKVVL